MSFTFTLLPAVLFALALGFGAGYIARRILANKRIAQAEERAQGSLADAKSKSQDILLESKNNALKLLEDGKREEQERRAQLGKIENLLTTRASDLEAKERLVTRQNEELHAKEEAITTIRAELETERAKQ